MCTDTGGEPYGCDPPLPGCSCTAGAPPIKCLLDGQPSDLIGSCQEGQSQCLGGTYGACELTGNPFCTHVGAGSGDFDLGDENSDNVKLGPEGEIILDPEVLSVEFGFLWIANTGENTVSKIDIETGREVARYAAVRDSNANGLPAVPIGGFDGDQNNCGNCPSRTAIDFKGDAFVANRAFNIQGSVTKYANSIEDCIDRNGNGIIDTSTDLNGDGVIDVNNPGEFLGEDDECILWTVPVGNNNGVPRALAIDAGGPDGEAGNLWVGLHNQRRVVQLSGDTGAPITAGGQEVQVGTENLRPYGAAVDGLGNLWVTGIQNDSGNTTYLAKVNTFTATLTQLYAIPDDSSGCAKSYGIVIDTSQRIWLGGWNCRDVKVFVPSTETWHRAEFGLDNTRGIAVDKEGQVWVALHNNGVLRFRAEDLIAMGDAAPHEIIELPRVPTVSEDVTQTIGVGIDRNGACWAVSRHDDSPLGAATRIATNGTIETFPTGLRPYTYSDFTGFGLSTVVRPNGFWRGTVEGCVAGDGTSEWTTLEWHELEPPGTSVRLRVRVGNTIEELAGASWYGPWDDSPVDLVAEGVPASRFLQIEVQLSTQDPGVTPSFLGFNLYFGCPGLPPID